MGFELRAVAQTVGAFRHPDGRRVTVMFHGPGRTFTRKTLKSMIQQTCWTEDDLRRLKLIR